MLRAPNRSASRPATGIEITRPSMNTVSTQPLQRSGAFRSRVSGPRATDTMPNWELKTSIEEESSAKIR